MWRQRVLAQALAQPTAAQQKNPGQAQRDDWAERKTQAAGRPRRFQQRVREREALVVARSDRTTYVALTT
ncbi:hypothetical protein C0Z20_09045 [Trinickia symbiotica]|uniref:Uncharacterized protein n=1 Tax=Trinickia symbiotica TaxID=863227 RepID=A0A2N7X5N6_9BURK|nr:hypothetical protein C0Z20_09045 [Trinickia symbiotica]